MDFAINFLRPPTWYPVIRPIRCNDRRLLQHEQIIAAPPRALAHTHSKIVPSNEIDGFLAIEDALVVSLAKPKGVDPAKTIGARCQHASYLAAARIDVILVHRRQRSTTFLASAFVAEFQYVEHAPVLRI